MSALLPGDLPVFKNKWGGLPGDLFVMLVPDVMCGTCMKHFTIQQGAVGMPGGVLEPLQCPPSPVESAPDWGGKTVSQTFAETPPSRLAFFE